MKLNKINREKNKELKLKLKTAKIESENKRLSYKNKMGYDLEKAKEKRAKLKQSINKRRYKGVIKVIKSISKKPKPRYKTHKSISKKPKPRGIWGELY